jgi:hypothetical protein
MAQQTQTPGIQAGTTADSLAVKSSTDNSLVVERSIDGLTVVQTTTPRTKNDGLQVVIRPGMVYLVEADPPPARAGRHRRTTPIKSPRARGPLNLVATLTGVALILAGVAVIAWTMAHQ